MQIKVLMIVCLSVMSSQLCAKSIIQGKSNISKSKAVIVDSHISNKDIQCVAETIYSEARGESLTGQLAVGATIVNRSTKIFHQPACKIVKQQYTQRKIPKEEREEFIKLAENILYGNVKNPVGAMDSFDSFKHNYLKRPKRNIKIGNHYFYKALKTEKV
jgi:spore germination cell wall hydrolase CwlJ-like protein